MEKEIRKQVNQILSFIDDEYTVLEYIKNDYHGQYVHLQTIPRKKLKKYISREKRNYKNDIDYLSMWSSEMT